MKLDGSTAAIVTGSASGLGEATARMLAGKGVKVALFDMNEGAGEAVATEIGGRFFPTDVTDEESVEAALAGAREAHGVERVLVNCAGIVVGRRTVATDRETGRPRAHDLASFRKVLDVNLVGSFLMSTKCAAAMAALEPVDADGQRGAIVQTSSVAGTDGQIGQVAYAASKGGVLGMVLPMARDLASRGIRVNAIQPGIFETPMVAGMKPEVQESLAASIPFPSRLGRAEEYALLACMLIEHDYLNGEAVRLDGAVRLAPR